MPDRTGGDAQAGLHEVEKASPGKRFQRLYERRQKSRHAKWINGCFNFGGLVVIGVGIATYPVPVIPSEIVILIGIALIAQGSMRAAVILDATELHLRRWLAPVPKLWKRLLKWLRRVLAIAWMFAVAGLSYRLYRALAD